MPGIVELIIDDLKNNISIKSKLIVVNYRILNYLYNLKGLKYIVLMPLFLVILSGYKILVELIIGCEISFRTKIGRGLIIHHGQSIVINKDTVIGDDVTIRHCTTIGNKLDATGYDLGSPVINNHVDIGSNSVIIGPIEIGSNVKIGAGSVVVKSTKDSVVIAGNPAKELNN